MDVWKYEIISRVEQDISREIILVNTRNKFHISAHPCIILYLMASSLSRKTLEEVLDDALLKRGLRDFTLKKEQYECIKSTINGKVALAQCVIRQFSASLRYVQLVLRCNNSSTVSLPPPPPIDFLLLRPCLHAGFPSPLKDNIRCFQVTNRNWLKIRFSQSLPRRATTKW